MEQPPRRGPRLRWTVWLVYLTVLTAILLSPKPVEVARDALPPETLSWASKGVHVTAYAALVVLSAWLGLSARASRPLLAFLSAHACATEFLQQFVPGRSGSWTDVGFNHLGLYLGLVVSWPWWRRD